MLCILIQNRIVKDHVLRSLSFISGMSSKVRRDRGNCRHRNPALPSELSDHESFEFDRGGSSLKSSWKLEEGFVVRLWNIHSCDGLVRVFCAGRVLDTPHRVFWSASLYPSRTESSISHNCRDALALSILK